MKTQILMVAIVAGMTLQAAPVVAQERGERPDFATLDANGDGALTLDELQAAPAARFAEVDTDGNGLLTADEMAASRAEAAADRIDRMIARLDTNEDGGISLREMQVMQRGGEERAARMFERVDANEDGSISAEEFEAAADRMSERRGGGKRGGGKGHGSRGDRG